MDELNWTTIDNPNVSLSNRHLERVALDDNRVKSSTVYPYRRCPADNLPLEYQLQTISDLNQFMHILYFPMCWFLGAQFVSYLTSGSHCVN